MPFKGCLTDLEDFGGCACVKNLRCVIKELSGKPDDEVRNSVARTARMLRLARLTSWHMLRLFESFWSTRMLQVPLRPAKFRCFT